MFEDIWKTTEKSKDILKTPSVPKPAKTKPISPGVITGRSAKPNSPPQHPPQGISQPPQPISPPQHPPTNIIRHNSNVNGDVTLYDNGGDDLITLKYRVNQGYKIYAYGFREYDKDKIMDAMYDWLTEIGF